jgi:hypothetical protein
VKRLNEIQPARSHEQTKESETKVSHLRMLLQFVALTPTATMGETVQARTLRLIDLSFPGEETFTFNEVA